MRFVAYTSKIFTLGIGGFLALFAWIISHAWKTMPISAQVIFAVLIGICALLCVYGMASAKPLIVADESGLCIYRIVIPVIEWDDILEVRHIPLIEKSPCGCNWYVLDRWRPLDLIIKNQDKYLNKLPKWAARNFKTDDPNHMRVRISCGGLTKTSRELLQCIEYYLSLSRQNSVSAT